MGDGRWHMAAAGKTNINTTKSCTRPRLQWLVPTPMKINEFYWEYCHMRLLLFRATRIGLKAESNLFFFYCTLRGALQGLRLQFGPKTCGSKGQWPLLIDHSVQRPCCLASHSSYMAVKQKTMASINFIQTHTHTHAEALQGFVVLGWTFLAYHCCCALSEGSALWKCLRLPHKIARDPSIMLGHLR